MKKLLVLIPLLLACYTNNSTTTRTPENKKISISVEDEIKGLLVDEKKYTRNRNGCVLTTGALIIGTIVTYGLTKKTELASLHLIGALATSGGIFWNWWAAYRSHKHAQEIAEENGFTIESSKEEYDWETAAKEQRRASV